MLVFIYSVLMSEASLELEIVSNSKEMLLIQYVASVFELKITFLYSLNVSSYESLLESPD